MKVRALKTCFVDNCLREIHSVFDYNPKVSGEINESVLVALRDEDPVDIPHQSQATKDAAAKAAALSATSAAQASAKVAADVKAVADAEAAKVAADVKAVADAEAAKVAADVKAAHDETVANLKAEHERTIADLKKKRK